MAIDNTISTIGTGFYVKPFDSRTVTFGFRLGTWSSATASVGHILKAENVQGSSGCAGGINIMCDDGGAAIGSSITTPIFARYLLTAGQTSGCTQTGLYAQLKTYGSLTFDTGGIRAGYFLNQAGTITLATNAEYVIINAACSLAGTMTVASGTMFAGIDVNIAGSGTVSNSNVAAGVVIRNKPAEAATWPIGLYIPYKASGMPIRIGTWNSYTTGYGHALDATNVNGSAGCNGAISVLCDDGGAAIGSSITTPIFSRYLLTHDQTSGATHTGMYSQIKTYGAPISFTNGGIRGIYTLNQVGQVTLAGTAELSGINAAMSLTGTLTVGATTKVLGVDINIAGSQTVSISAGGVMAGLGIRKAGSGSNVWPIGIWIEPTSSTNAMLLGHPWGGSSKTTYTGMTPNFTDSWDTTSGARVGFYFDDRGSAITSWGECFTVGQAVLTTSTGGTHTGWPYTAFFYTDVEANVTDTGANHWPTLMTSFIVGSGITLDGFTTHGCSSHHASVDVNGTLASNNLLSCISFGGNWPGTVSGKIYPMHIRPTNQSWTALIRLPTGSGIVAATAGSQDTSTWICVDVGGTIKKIPTYATS